MGDKTNTSTNIFEEKAITDIQTFLRHLSFHSDNIGDLPIDGIWDSSTSDALIAFQRENGLSPTGIADRETYDLLKREYDRSVALNSPPARLDLFPRSPLNFEIKEGDTGILVDTVQFILNELERLYSFQNLNQSGIYDSATASAIKLFQEKNMINTTGRVGRETWDALAIQHNLLDKYNE